eukprot:m.82646 g.82646  ORF g.82646 m.82646 type:complete len:528 (+) comp14927_c0_seq1:255-1838(+)
MARSRQYPAMASSSMLAMALLLCACYLGAVVVHAQEVDGSSSSSDVDSATSSTEACLSVELARIGNGDARKAVERYHAIARVENEHSVYTGWDSNSLGLFVYYMPSIAVTTAKSNSSVAGWAIDQRVGNPVPEIILSDCDETPGNMGPDTCSSVHARLKEDIYNEKVLAQENCLACSRDFYLASPLVGGSHCLRRHTPGEQCWQQDQCLSNACWGYHCCAEDVASNDTRCAACDSHGQCICDASLLCEIFGTALACNNRDLRTSPCGLPRNTTVLNLQNNSLSAITPLVLDSIPQLDSLCLGDNPLNCCSMIPVQHHPALDRNCPKPAACASPLPFRGMLVRDVDPNSLLQTCFGDSPNTEAMTNELTKIIGGVVFCIFVAFAAFFAVRFFRRRRQHRLRLALYTENPADPLDPSAANNNQGLPKYGNYGTLRAPDTDEHKPLLINTDADADAGAYNGFVYGDGSSSSRLRAKKAADAGSSPVTVVVLLNDASTAATSTDPAVPDSASLASSSADGGSLHDQAADAR